MGHTCVQVRRRLPEPLAGEFLEKNRLAVLPLGSDAFTVAKNDALFYSEQEDLDF